MSTKESEPKDEPLLPQNGKLGTVDSPTEKPAEKMVATDDTPKSLSLDVPNTNMDADDKLDELSRLQLEMAELNKSELTTNDHTKDKPTKSSEIIKEAIDANSVEIKNHTQKDVPVPTNNKKGTTDQNGQRKYSLNSLEPSFSNTDTEILGHEDLIAVLKGETVENTSEIGDSSVDELEKPKIESTEAEEVTTTDADLLIEGVTIEGEGEYQIMEVVDDFDEETENAAVAPVVETKEPTSGAHAGVGGSKGNVSAKLTREEERAMAMEQIAGLNARAPRRRKQDIKPLQVETSELVSTIGADWSDDDDIGVSGIDRSLLGKSAKAAKKESLPILPQVVATAEAKFTTVEQKSLPELAASGKKRRRSVGGKVTNMIVLSPSHQADKEADSSIKLESASTTAQEPPNSTGFKRTRAIKRRIIWDPDAPETSFSYANLVRNNAKDRQESTSPVAAPKSRSVTPKDKRIKADLPAEKKAIKRAATPSKAAATKESVLALGSNATENVEMPTTSKQMRRSQTISPVANGSLTQVGGKKKKISEIDRLMRDEGAANMLSSLESGRVKLEEEDDDKPHKPLMRSRGVALEKITKKETTPSPTATTSTTAKNKRVAKSKPSTSWDYVYQKKQLSEDSMIIRRRSNSSYSSTASQHRLSLDGPAGTTPNAGSKSGDTSLTDVSCDEATIDSTLEDALPPSSINIENDINNSISPRNSPKATASMKQSAQINAAGSKSFEFAKPKDTKSNSKVTNRRSKADTTEGKKNLPKRAGPGRPPNSERQQNAEHANIQQQHSSELSTEPASGPGADVHVRKIGKVAQIVFSLNTATINGTFTYHLMNQIVKALDGLASDDSCHVVTITANSSEFCQGVDFSNLATGTAEQRKSAASVLATATKNYLKTLATFPKPLVVGIHGAIVGLGVTQLPLFDVVIASDKTTLETPYIKIGQVPEGYCLWQNLPSVRGTAKVKLFWLGEKLHSTEASTSGLICKLTTADKVNDDVLNIAKGMANMSAVVYRSMKSVVIQSRLEAIISALDDEFDEIIKHWTSAECYNKFKKFIEVKHF